MDLVLKMTEPDPQRRWTAYELLSHEWFVSTQIPPSVLLEEYYECEPEFTDRSEKETFKLRSVIKSAKKKKKVNNIENFQNKTYENLN